MRIETEILEETLIDPWKLEDIKTHLRINNDKDDILLMHLQRLSVNELQNYTNMFVDRTKRKFIIQKADKKITLPCNPITEIESFQADGKIRKTSDCRISDGNSISILDKYVGKNIMITANVGFASKEKIPSLIMVGIINHTAYLYENDIHGVSTDQLKKWYQQYVQIKI